MCNLFRFKKYFASKTLCSIKQNSPCLPQQGKCNCLNCMQNYDQILHGKLHFFFCSEYCPFHVNGLVYLITFFILIFFALSTKSVCATCHMYSIIHFKGTLLNTFYFLRYAHVRYVKSLFTKLNGQITRQFLGLRIRNLQGIVFT